MESMKRRHGVKTPGKNHLKSSLAVVVLDFFIGSSEQQNPCTAILHDSKEREDAVSVVPALSLLGNTNT